MYATRLRADSDDHDATWDAMVDQVRRWAWRAQILPKEALERSGHAEAGGRELRWSSVVVDGSPRRVWQLDLINPADVGGVRYQASTSVTRDSDSTTMFVTISRLAADARLAPAPIGEFRRPGVIQQTLNTVPCRVGSQLLSATPRRVRASGIAELITSLHDPDRVLPIVIVSTTEGNPESVALARQLADDTCGLAHVVQLDSWLALDALQARLPKARLPLHGVRLFWPMFGTEVDRWHHPWWTPAATRDDRRPDFPAYLFQMLARLSGVALTRDDHAESVREAARVAQRAEAERRLTEAQAGGDLDVLVDELQAALATEKQCVLDLLEENERLDHQVQTLQSYKENFDALVDWRTSAEDGPNDAALATESVDPQDRDFSNLWEELQSQSDGAMVFTDRARDSWDRCGYPNPERMRSALVKLTQAAAEWRALDGRLGKSLTSWITEITGLTYAPSDEAMERLKIGTFDFEGRSLSRVPHIKLDDHVAPDRVGRIHFAIDTIGHRWVVDHVGLKMHGVSRP